jgi:hypothetical protein
MYLEIFYRSSAILEVAYKSFPLTEFYFYRRVQEEKTRRSNVAIGEHGTFRKPTQYSEKRDRAKE